VIGLDTNVLVRYLAQDDPQQARLATRLMERTLSEDEPGYVDHVVLCELGWVLERCYGVDRARLAGIVEGLLTARELVVEDADAVWAALRAMRAHGVDLADALLAARHRAAGCERTVTFDRRAARLPGMSLLAGR